MTITAEAVKQLRDRTGMQMMKCKEALIATNGDMDKAIQYLRERNKDAQVKSAGRETAEGRIGVFLDPAAKVGAILELRCESLEIGQLPALLLELPRANPDERRQALHAGAAPLARMAPSWL